jgi:AcrR family transcriptional regulator
MASANRRRAQGAATKSGTRRRDGGGSGAGRRQALDRAAWIVEGRNALVAGGIGAVKIGQLAAALGVTREAFYWHFKSLDELHGALRADWSADNTTRFEASLADPGRAPLKDLESVSSLLLGEEAFRTGWDTAMRDWARTSEETAILVARIDDERTRMLQRVFHELGYSELEALARARIYYLFQVGYYTTRIEDSLARRRKLIPEYLRILLGRD